MTNIYPALLKDRIKAKAYSGSSVRLDTHWGGSLVQIQSPRLKTKCSDNLAVIFASKPSKLLSYLNLNE